MQFEIDERVDGLHAVDRADAAAELDEVVVVLADHLGEQVVGAGGEHDVVGRGDRTDGLRDLGRVAAHLDAHHRLAGEAELHRVGHRDDLHDAGLLQLLNPLAHGRLAEAHGLADLGVGAAPVLLELLDDRFRDRVEGERARPGGHGSIVTVALPSDKRIRTEIGAEPAESAVSTLSAPD